MTCQILLVSGAIVLLTGCQPCSPRMAEFQSKTRNITRPGPTSRQRRYAAGPRSSLVGGSRAFHKGLFVCYSARAAMSPIPLMHIGHRRTHTTLQPKSAIFNSPFNPVRSVSKLDTGEHNSPMSRFSGLISRCITCFLCK